MTYGSLAPVVLAIDDEPSNLLLVDAVLAPLGMQVVTATSAREAPRALGGRRPAVALVDVMMPGWSGIDFCRAMRADEAWDQIPLVMLTALTACDHRTECLIAGADDFLEKPLDIDELARTTRRWVATGRHSGILPDDEAGLMTAMAAAGRRGGRVLAGA